MTFDELATKLDEQLKLMNLKYFYYDAEDKAEQKTSYYFLDDETSLVVIRHFTKVVLFTDSMKTQFFNVIKEDEIDDKSFDLVIKSIQKVLSEIKKEKIKEKIKQIKKDF
jgi:hypothetical protein